MSKWRPTCARCGKRFTAPVVKGVEEIMAIGITNIKRSGSSIAWNPHNICPACFNDFCDWFGGPKAGMMRWISEGCPLD